MGVHLEPSSRGGDPMLTDIVVSGVQLLGGAANGTGSSMAAAENAYAWLNTTPPVPPGWAATTPHPPAHNAPYEIVWTGEVLFRVVTIIIVMVLTLLGNTTLILIITCHPAERRKRVNVFLVNLALGDLMVCVFTMTTEILFVAFGEWVLGAAACKIIVYGQIVTLSSAVFLLAAMSIDRYQVLVQPLRSLAGRPRIWKKVTAAWLLSFIVAIPQLFIFVQTDEGYHVDGSIKHLCRSQGYTAQWQRKVYFTYMTTYILVIPTIIMSFCYFNIIRVVWKRTDSDHTEKGSMKISFRFRRKPTGSSRDQSHGTHNGLHSLDGNRHRGGNGGNGGGGMAQNRLRIPKKLVSSSKRNVVKMTLSVIVGFLICWTPYFVISLARIYSDYRLDLKVGLAVAEVMALVHSAMNPILYVIFCTRHAKAALLRMTRCLHTKSHLESHSMGDEGVSDDDTATWSDNRRFSSVHIRHQGRIKTCCADFLHKLRACVCPCTKTLAPGQGHNSLAMGFYQELVPNRTAGGAMQGCTVECRGGVQGRTGGTVHVFTGAESQLSDSENLEFENGQTERRQTLSYVVANPNVTNSAQDCISAV